MQDFTSWREWKLAVKLDPDKILPPESYDLISHPSIDAIIVGGTQNVHYNNTMELVNMVRQGYSGPILQEVSSLEAVVPLVDGYLIPMVLNAGDKKWLVEHQLEAIKRYGNLIDWDKVIGEGYLVCNQNSAVGRLTEVDKISIKDAEAYTVLAEELLGLPLLYIEYSGVFGDIDLVESISRARKNIHLFYGGGITSPQLFKTVAPLVDTVVVGNVFYEDPQGASAVLRTAGLF